jgi:Lrp/AsnC family leucine-responsive transcriptional regulator
VRELDEVDMEILELLAADARRAYSEIGDAVGLSGPAVSDRVSKLEAAGVLEGFTIDVDRSQLREGVPVLLELELAPAVDAHATDDDAHATDVDAHATDDDAHATDDDAHATDDDAHATDVDAHATECDREHVRERLRDADAVEHVFTTANGDVVVQASLPDSRAYRWVAETVGEDAVRVVDVTLLASVEWTQSVGATDFAVSCAECGNTVTSEGTTATIGEDTYRFCCASCESAFRERYDDLAGA